MCVRNKMYVRSCVSAWVTLRVGSLAAKTVRERLDNKRACVFVSFVEVVHLAVLDHSVHDVRPGNFDPRVPPTLWVMTGNPPTLCVWLFSQEGCRNTIGLLGKWGFT